ncbi:hypothetical protein CEQ90_12490 [Lewinellaceae bacterium SD302]|nr:hypothetical protein CEQ90_12490 [Lewinellaceae bacterium SD302]
MKKSPLVILAILSICCLSFSSYLYLEIREDSPEKNLLEQRVLTEGNLPQAGATLVIGKAIGALQRLLMK